MPKSETKGNRVQKFCRCQSVYLTNENKNKHMTLPETLFNPHNNKKKISIMR